MRWSLFTKRNHNIANYNHEKVVSFTDGEKHIDLISELTQQINDMGAIIEEKWKIAILLSSLPAYYDNIADTLEARPANDITWGIVTSKLIDVFNRRRERSSDTIIEKLYLNDEKMFCYYCKRYNHKMKDCKFLKAKKEKEKNQEKQKTNDEEKQSNRDRNEQANYLLSITETNAMNSWIIDSGSTRHICCDRNKFKSISNWRTKSI